MLLPITPTQTHTHPTHFSHSFQSRSEPHSLSLLTPGITEREKGGNPHSPGPPWSLVNVGFIPGTVPCWQHDREIYFSSQPSSSQEMATQALISFTLAAHIQQIWNFISAQITTFPTKRLVQTTIISHLDYCSSLLIGFFDGCHL